MASSRLIATLLLWIASLGYAATEELPELPKGCLSSEDQCYTAGDITGAVVGTLVVTLALLALAYGIYRIYWRGRRGKHLVLVTDPEGGITDDYAFDNPCFRDGTPIGRGGYEKEPVKSDHKNRWSAWSPLGAIVGSRNEKRRALDDSFTGEPQVNVVALRSHDFTGLGFNVCGNMRDGIYVKDVLHRGPASESGRISPGDRIDSIRISFRHMVFEDALTILSYASPYEVQLEVENPSPSSRPSTLIRTKRSSIEPADRICHPFYRSQSIADLAEIGKSSLKMGQDSGSKSPRSKTEMWDESRAGDYPTLKLSPLPTKETLKLEKTAASPSNPGLAAIVKPERARKVAPKEKPHDKPVIENEGTSNKEVKTEPTGKHQKFGIRVLPDPKALPQLKNVSGETRPSESSGTSHKSKSGENVDKLRPTSLGDLSSKSLNAVEAERRENERNSMVEQTGGIVSPVKTMPAGKAATPVFDVTPRVTEDVLDAGRIVANSSFYDERGIDVGPAEEEENRRKASLGGGEPGNKGDDGSIKPDSTGHEGHSNVKLLLTKGFQNLKEKLHHHDKKKTGSSPEPQTQPEVSEDPRPFKKVSAKAVKKTKTSESSDSEDAVEKGDSKPTKTSKLVPDNGEKKDKERKDSKKTNLELRQEETSNEGNIPTEIPEEMHRAAMAARNNRRASGYIPPDTQVLSLGPETNNSNPKEVSSTSVNINEPASDATPATNYPPVKYRVRQQESLSEDSSGDDLGAATSGSNDTDSIGRAPKRSNKRKAPIPPSNEDGGENPTDISARVARPEASVAHKIGESNGSGSRTEVSENNPSIMLQDNPNGDHNIQTMEVRINAGKIPLFTDMSRQQNTPLSNNDITNIAVESNSTVTPSSDEEKKNPTSSGGDLKIIIDNHSTKNDNNSESDSDDENQDALATRKQKNKGGTTIELNSSHITIHHSPSSDTVALEIENDSTRKAASMGDLSRLDSEQPMSVLERAVSLDLADGGTPHSSKKRKAPLPPPGDEYMNTVQDSDDGGTYRKEPRLDTALDTFQRRRLKKSSDWGTMEDAIQQDQDSPQTSVRRSLASPTNILVGTMDDEPTSLTISIGDDDTDVFIESKPQYMVSSKDEVKGSSVPVASVRTMDSAGRAYLFPGIDDDVRSTSDVNVNIFRGNFPEAAGNGVESTGGSQRAVWRITPESRSPAETITSHVTVAQSSGPSSLIDDRLEPRTNIDTISTSHVTIGKNAVPTMLMKEQQDPKGHVETISTSHVTIGQSSGRSNMAGEFEEPQSNVDVAPASHVTISQSSGPSSLISDHPEPRKNTDTISTSQVTIGQSSGLSNLISDQLEPRIVDVVTTSQVTIAQNSVPSNVAGDRLVRSATPEDDTEINGSRLLSFIQGEYRNKARSSLQDSVEADTSTTLPFTSQTSDNHTIVSSTPIAKRDQAYRRVETIQSPQVTSSDGGVRNINVVSSTTRIRQQVPSEGNVSISGRTPNISVDSTIDDDSSVSITSTSEPFITAGSIVDSTTTFVGNSDEDDSTWAHDSQPPELPTSPVPILTSMYNPSSSMTYITEIQVTTLTPNKVIDSAVTESATDVNGLSERREMIDSNVLTSNNPQSISPDSMGSDGEDSDMEGTNRTRSGGAAAQNGGLDYQRNNVTVTAIRSASGSTDRSRIPMRVGNDGSMTTFQSGSIIERSQIPLRTVADGLLTTFQQSHASGISAEPSHIPMRMGTEGVLTTFQNNSNVGNAERSHIPMRIVTTVLKDTSPTGNGIGEKKGKAVRPPVPPRKSDSSMSSVINVEVPNVNRSPENAQSNLSGHSFTNYGSSPRGQNNSGGKKFISFSSLTPRPVSGEGTGRNSSFEQWVFLDETQGHTTNGSSHNGQDNTGDETSQHSSVVTLPGGSTNRPHSVTHIVLDSKQSSGKRGSP